MIGWTREVHHITHRVLPARFVAGLALELHPYRVIVVRKSGGGAEELFYVKHGGRITCSHDTRRPGRPT